MEKADVVIIGGSAAGITAAITARRHYPTKKICLIRKESKVPIPCGIPYIYGTVGTPEKNLIPDSTLEKNSIELLIDEVVDINVNDKKITTQNMMQIAFDKLVLATGSSPVIPAIPGSDKENVFLIDKDVKLLTRMQETLQQCKKVSIIGGGFIGVEFSDECNKSGNVEVTILEVLPHCLQLAFDPEFCMTAEKILSEKGIGVISGQEVVEIVGNHKVDGLYLSDETILDTDMVLIAVGNKANVGLAEKAKLKIGPTGAIWVDRNMKTSNPNIFACGDCAEKISFFGGAPSKLKLASIACSEARIAGANLFWLQRENIGTIGVFSTVLDGRAFAVAGLTERHAKNLGYEVITGTSEGPNRHPGGMPGMTVEKVKLTFERQTKNLIGAQLLGDTAVGELVNVASACIQHRMDIDDIACFQMGTHPALTASPIAYQFVNAAEDALG
jgi:NADPH-dependent 2,4-dienoyl-CoA reductase/sulfur reductase-like enzyme